MNKNQGNEYTMINVESFEPASTSGLHGKVHVRPLPDQDPYLPEMKVSCSDELTDELSIYPVGTKFTIKAKVYIRK